MIFRFIYIRQIPWVLLKIGCQQLPWHLANVNVLKSMFNPYNGPDQKPWQKVYTTMMLGKQ